MMKSRKYFEEFNSVQALIQAKEQKRLNNEKSANQYAAIAHKRQAQPLIAGAGAGATSL